MTKTAETTYRALLLNLLVSMMEIDGRIDQREMETIGDIYEEIVGFRLDQRARDKLVGSVAVSRREALEMLRARAHLLREHHRQGLLQLALRMLKSDLTAHPKEWSYLLEIGLAAGMTDHEIEQFLG